MKTIVHLIAFLSLTSFAQDPYDTCTEQLKENISKTAKKKVCSRINCKVPSYSVQMNNYMAEEQNPGLVYYAVSGCKMYGQNAECHEVFFKAETFRSSEQLEGQPFFCNLKKLTRISATEFDKLAGQNP